MVTATEPRTCRYMSIRIIMLDQVLTVDRGKPSNKLAECL